MAAYIQAARAVPYCNHGIDQSAIDVQVYLRPLVENCILRFPVSIAEADDDAWAMAWQQIPGHPSSFFAFYAGSNQTPCVLH